MNRLLLVIFFLIFFFLLIFFISQIFGLDLELWVHQLESWTLPFVAIAVIFLLIIDVFLPIPSSLIMIANGATFGLIGGAIISIIGGTGAALVGYFVGKLGKSKVKKWISDKELDKGHRFTKRWGSLAVIISRPIPIIAETVAIVAGICGIRFFKMILFSFLGVLPMAFIYAWAGAYLISDPLGILPMSITLGIGILFILAEKRIKLLQKR